MLNTFPSMLVFGFFAPTILRIAVAGFFFYIAYDQIRRRENIANIPFSLVGKGAWIPLLTAVVYFCLGSMLLVGYYTQIAALLGILGAIKNMWLVQTRPTFIPLSMGSVFLIFIILCTLLLSGAGALALDLPL